MALASVAPPSTVVRTPEQGLLKGRVLLIRAENFQALHQRQAGVDHDGELAEEDGHFLDLDLAAAERGHGKFLALLANGAGRDAFLAELLRQSVFIGGDALSLNFFARSGLP